MSVGERDTASSSSSGDSSPTRLSRKRGASFHSSDEVARILAFQVKRQVILYFVYVNQQYSILIGRLLIFCALQNLLIGAPMIPVPAFARQRITPIKETAEARGTDESDDNDEVHCFFFFMKYPINP